MLRITLKAARVNSELTQAEVAMALHKTKQTIVNWENGKTEIKYHDLLRLSELYAIPLENLRLPEFKKEELQKKQ